MPTLNCTARRIGDLESRTEEYELSFSLAQGASRGLRVKYQAARAYEINAALDASVEVARATISAAGLDARPPDGALSQLAWRTVQAAKYRGGEPSANSLEL